MLYSEEEIRETFCCYGVDLIRTAGLLVRLSPSSIYRASILFQRFQQVVERQYRQHYLSESQIRELILKERSVIDGTLPKEAVKEFLETLGKVEYVLPPAGEVKASGLPPLGDIFAPVDYCVVHHLTSEDILYLVGACLLMVSKLEDQQVRIRSIVNVCIRLTHRRGDNPPVSADKAKTTYYDDFKSCVAEAENIVLQQLGFQTFVECPIKYGILILHLLVEDTTAVDNGGTSGPTQCSDEFYDWQVRVVQCINDIPRYAEFLEFSAKDIAVVAVHLTRPPSVELPDGWYMALGTPELTVAQMTSILESKKKIIVSSRVRLGEIKKGIVYYYRTRQEWAKVQFDLYRAKEKPIPPPSPEVVPVAAPEPDPPIVKSVTPPPLPAPSLNPDDFEDIIEVQKRKRKEEKERKEREKEERRKREEAKEKEDRRRKEGSSRNRKRSRSRSDERRKGDDRRRDSSRDRYGQRRDKDRDGPSHGGRSSHPHGSSHTDRKSTKSRYELLDTTYSRDRDRDRDRDRRPDRRR